MAVQKGVTHRTSEERGISTHKTLGERDVSKHKTFGESDILTHRAFGKSGTFLNIISEESDLLSYRTF